MHTDVAFPTQKWNDSVRFLVSYAPWWGNFVGKFRIRPRNNLGGIVLTKELDAIVDPFFLLQNSIPTIATRLEFSCEFLTRKLDSRFSSHTPKEPLLTFMAMAKSMEVYDSMARAREGLNLVDFSRDLQDVFPDFEEKYGEIELPTIPDDAVTSWSFGLQRGDSAENFYHQLVNIDDAMRRRRENEEDTQDSESQDSDVQANTEQTEEDSSPLRSDEIHDAQDSSDSSQENTPDSQTPETPKTPEQNNNQATKQTGQDSSQTPETSEEAEQDQQGETDSSPQTQESDSLEETLASAIQQQQQQKQQQLEQAYKQQLETVANNIPKPLTTYDSIMDKIQDGYSENRRFDATDHSDVHHNYEKEEEQYSEQEYVNALREAAKEIIISQRGNLKNAKLPMSESLVEIAEEITRADPGHWTKVLEKVLSKSLSGAQMSGQSDLSYAKRNPNQRKDQPVIMGFITYPPEVTLIVDCSASMMRFRDTILKEFTAIAKSVIRRYGTSITWVLADTTVHYAENSFNPYGKGYDKISRSRGGGTDLSEVILFTLNHGARWGRRTYPKPDLTIILTDCGFEWFDVDKKRLPAKYGAVVVASVHPKKSLEKTFKISGQAFPEWLVEGKNFVYLG